jgi:hypothetical protein
MLLSSAMRLYKFLEKKFALRALLSTSRKEFCHRLNVVALYLAVLLDPDPALASGTPACRHAPGSIRKSAPKETM